MKIENGDIGRNEIFIVWVCREGSMAGGGRGLWSILKHTTAD